MRGIVVLRLVRRTTMPTDDWKQSRLKVAVRGLFVEDERRKEKWKEASYSKMSRSTASTSSSSVKLRKIEGVQSLGRQKEMKQVLTRVLLHPLNNTPHLNEARTSSEADQMAVTQEQYPGQVSLDGVNVVLLIDMIWS